MTWSKFDDVYDEHERIEDAWHAFPPNPVGLHVMATTACNRWLSDGVIRPRWLTKMLPHGPTRKRVLEYMVEAQLLDFLPVGRSKTVTDQAGNGVMLGPFGEDRYLVHDFLDRHESSQTIKAKREKEASRKRQERRQYGKTGEDVRQDVQPDGDGMSERSPGWSPPRGPARAPAPASRPDQTNTSTTPGEEPESTEPANTVVTFDRKPVPPDRLKLAEDVLAEFNRQAKTRYAAFTGRGRASEDLKRIIGALSDADPPLELDECRRMIRRRLAHPFWDGKPHTGVVFGPKALAANRENARAVNGTAASGSLAGFQRSYDAQPGAAA